MPHYFFVAIARKNKMDNGFNYFQSIFSPMLLVAATYAAVLLPTYKYLKNKKPDFWWMIWSLSVEVMVIDLLIFYLLFKSNFKDFFIGLNFSSVLLSALVFLVLPIALKKYIKREKGETLFVAYALMFFLAASQVGAVLIIIAWGATQIFRSFG